MGWEAKETSRMGFMRITMIRYWKSAVLYLISNSPDLSLICFVLRRNWICCPSWSKEGAEPRDLALLGWGDNWKWDSLETLGGFSLTSFLLRIGRIFFYYLIPFVKPKLPLRLGNSKYHQYLNKIWKQVQNLWPLA